MQRMQKHSRRLHTIIASFIEYDSNSVTICIILQGIFYCTAYFGECWLLLAGTLSQEKAHEYT
jgi:hypothetical protein